MRTPMVGPLGSTDVSGNPQGYSGLGPRLRSGTIYCPQHPKKVLSLSKAHRHPAFAKIPSDGKADSPAPSLLDNAVAGQHWAWAVHKAHEPHSPEQHPAFWI